MQRPQGQLRHHRHCARERPDPEPQLLEPLVRREETSTLRDEVRRRGPGQRSELPDRPRGERRLVRSAELEPEQHERVEVGEALLGEDRDQLGSRRVLHLEVESTEAPRETTEREGDGLAAEGGRGLILRAQRQRRQPFEAAQLGERLVVRVVDGELGESGREGRLADGLDQCRAQLPDVDLEADEPCEHLGPGERCEPARADLPAAQRQALQAGEPRARGEAGGALVADREGEQGQGPQALGGRVVQDRLECRGVGAFGKLP